MQDHQDEEKLAKPPQTTTSVTLSEQINRITNATDLDPEPSGSKTFAAAWHDLVRGFHQHELWLQLGWQDIKQRYRRSVLGPLWITIATGVMAAALGLLYSVLFKIPVAQFLPHVTVGLIMWTFISGCIKEGAQVFIDNEGLIKQLPSALSVHVYRLVWKQTLFLGHNLIIWVALMVIFPRPLGWDFLLAIPALMLLIANGVWVSMFFGIIAHPATGDVATPPRSRAPQLLFYVTPHCVDDSNPERPGRNHLRPGETGPTQPALPLHGGCPRPAYRRRPARLPLVGCARVYRCWTYYRPACHAAMAVPGQLLGITLKET